jgi:hypothetical protein
MADDDDCRVPMAQWQPREAIQQMAMASASSPAICPCSRLRPPTANSSRRTSSADCVTSIGTRHNERHFCALQAIRDAALLGDRMGARYPTPQPEASAQQICDKYRPPYSRYPLLPGLPRRPGLSGIRLLFEVSNTLKNLVQVWSLAEDHARHGGVIAA